MKQLMFATKVYCSAKLSNLKFAVNRVNNLDKGTGVPGRTMGFEPTSGGTTILCLNPITSLATLAV